MVRSIKIVFLLIVALYAKDEMAIFQEAKKLYDKKEFQKSYQILKEIVFDNLTNPKINFYFGRSALEVGEFYDAELAFERVLMMNPNDDRTKLELARVYLEEKNYKLAYNYFKIVCDKKEVPIEVKKNIYEYLNYLSMKLNADNFRGSVSLGLLSDSNVNNNIGEREFKVPTLDFAFNGEKKVSDFAHYEVINLNYLHNLNSYFIDNYLNLYNKSYLNERDRNIFLGNLSSAFGYQNRLFQLSIPIGYDKLFYGGNNYFYTFDISPTLKMKFHDYYIYSTISLKNRNYLNRNSDKSSNIIDFDFKIKKDLSKDSTLSLKLNFEKEEKSKGDRSDISNNLVGVKLSYYKSLNKIDIFPQFNFYKTDFKDMDIFYQKRREDLTYIPSLTLIYKFNKSMNISFDYSYIKNSSNFTPYDYSKNLFSLSFSKSF